MKRPYDWQCVLAVLGLLGTVVLCGFLWVARVIQP